MFSPRRCALVSTAAVVAASLSVPAAVAADNPAGCTDPAQVSSKATGLQWNLKDSYLSYIQGAISRGTVTAVDGATFTAPFGPATYKGTSAAGAYWNTPGEEFAFAGGLHLLGHGGDLDVTVKDLKLKVGEGNTGEIVGDYEVRGKNASDKKQDAQGDDVVLATVTFDAPLAKATQKQSVPMTVKAADAFAKLSDGNYAKGTVLSQAVLQLENTGDCVLPGDDTVAPQRDLSFFDTSAEWRAQGSSTGSAVVAVIGVVGLLGGLVALAANVPQLAAMLNVPLPQLPQLPL